MSNPGILIIVPTFFPNVGGVETHLSDLVSALDKRGYPVYVHTYSPITTPGVAWNAKESFGNVHIRRYGWFGKTLLHKVEKYPILDFLYITPYLFVRTLIFCLFNHKKIDIIHAQGFNAAFIGKYLKKIFRKKLIVSTHAVYEVNSQSRTASLLKQILNGADEILTLSKASYNELVKLGIDEKKIKIFKYWINLDVFKPLENKRWLRKELGLPDGFLVLFVGRLTEIKGVRELVSVAEKLPEVKFVFVGNGPLENFLKTKTKKKNVIFVGRVDNKLLYRYYNAANVFCIPSQYEEGFGRVVMEAVACGTPVVGAKKGGIPEALDDSVSILVEPTVENLKDAIYDLYANKSHYAKLKEKCSEYAQINFSESNLEKITAQYSYLR